MRSACTYNVPARQETRRPGILWSAPRLLVIAFIHSSTTMTSIKKGAITAAALVILGTGAANISSVSAAEDIRTNGVRDIVQALADTFGVSTNDVQSVFDKQRALHEAERETHAAERLAGAVADNILTQEQADAIASHHAEMRELMESLKNATPEERKTALETQREEHKNWAKEHNIPEDLFRTPHEGKQGHQGMPGMRHISNE